MPLAETLAYGAPLRVDEAGLSLVGGGFTNVIDLAYGPDGMLYVLEFANNGLLSGDPTGGLWRLNPMTGIAELLMTEGLLGAHCARI